MDTYHTINIRPYGRRIKAKPGSRLLEVLTEQSLFLRTDCGGKGTCGKCLVKLGLANGLQEKQPACTCIITEDIIVEIPESSLQPYYIVSKAPLRFPETFTGRLKLKARDCPLRYGIAVDLGTTTIAVYLCNVLSGEVLASVALKNLQAMFGDDVMSRIGIIGQDIGNLSRLQQLVIRAVEWGMRELFSSIGIKKKNVSRMVVVGNPAMIHILAGVDPSPIGVSPYKPAFFTARKFHAHDIGFSSIDISIQTLPQVSGFIGGDILSAAIAVDFENQPAGTLLVDLGTNGELLLKGREGVFAASCATGPAFEGASLSCGMQAVPGAVNKVEISSARGFPQYTIINPTNDSQLKPSGICGTGVISAVVQLCINKIVEPSGAFSRISDSQALQKDAAGKMQFTVIPGKSSQDGEEIFISQKDIRSVQLGKAALISGIELLLRQAGLEKAEKIIIAGAFGTFIDIDDMIFLGMIPAIDIHRIEVVGNSAGAGAIMVLCDEMYLQKATRLADLTTTVDLACNLDFQDIFIKNLHFPKRRRSDKKVPLIKGEDALHDRDEL